MIEESLNFRDFVLRSSPMFYTSCRALNSSGPGQGFIVVADGKLGRVILVKLGSVSARLLIWVEGSTMAFVLVSRPAVFALRCKYRIIKKLEAALTCSAGVPVARWVDGALGALVAAWGLKPDPRSSQRSALRVSRPRAMRAAIHPIEASRAGAPCG